MEKYGFKGKKWFKKYGKDIPWKIWKSGLIVLAFKILQTPWGLPDKGIYHGKTNRYEKCVLKAMIFFVKILIKTK